MATYESGYHGNTTSEVVLIYLKAYLVPVTVCSGLVVSFIAIVVSNSGLTKRSPARLPCTVGALGNMIMLILRPSINYWWGDGLGFSTNGSVYVYIDQISETACKVTRAFGFLSETVPIAVLTWDSCQCLLTVFGYHGNQRLLLLALAIYFSVAGLQSALTAHFAFAIVPQRTSLSGQSCSVEPTSNMNRILVIVSCSAIYGLPSAVTLAMLLVILTRCRKVDFARSTCEKTLGAELLSLAIRIVLYNVFLWAIFGSILTSAVAGSEGSMEAMHFCYILSSVLPLCDFAALCVLGHFRKDLLDCCLKLKRCGARKEEANLLSVTSFNLY